MAGAGYVGRRGGGRDSGKRKLKLMASEGIAEAVSTC